MPMTGALSLLAIPGDGIGREVVPVALRLLSQAVPDLVIEVQHAGNELWRDRGESISAGTLTRVGQVDAVLFGATGTPAPPPRGYVSPILALRQELQLNVNIRYCRSPSGSPLDVVMVRDISEGLYVQREREIDGGLVAEHQVTVQATEKVARAAARCARERQGRVTVVHKANVLERTDGLFRRVAIDTLEAEGVAWDEALSDAAGYHLVANPGRYDVMVMTSHVGDLLSDVGAAVAGGLGLVPSVSFGNGPPLAEPIHGSAPDLVGTGTADPVAAVLSASLLLFELKLLSAGRQMRNAALAHLAAHPDRRHVRTADVADDIERRMDSKSVRGERAASLKRAP